MKILDNIDDCTGCSACMNVCPQQCIKMCQNSEGFLYPQIDNDICINCNLCKKHVQLTTLLKKLAIIILLHIYVRINLRIFV